MADQVALAEHTAAEGMAVPVHMERPSAADLERMVAPSVLPFLAKHASQVVLALLGLDRQGVSVRPSLFINSNFYIESCDKSPINSLRGFGVLGRSEERR